MTGCLVFALLLGIVALPFIVIGVFVQAIFGTLLAVRTMVSGVFGTRARVAPLDPSQLRNDLNDHYAHGRLESAEALYEGLPDWPVVRQLITTVRVHHEYYRQIGKAASFFEFPGYELRSRWQEAYDLLGLHIDLASRVAGLSADVGGRVRNLEPQLRMELDEWANNWKGLENQFELMQRELRKLWTRQDPDNVAKIADALARHSAAVLALDRSYQQEKRIRGELN